LKLFPRPASFGTAIMVVPSPEAALSLLALARDHAGEGISAFELLSGVGLKFLARYQPDTRQPFADIPEWSVLIDLGLAAGQDGRAVIEALFAEGFEAGLVSDGVLAESGAQRDALWAVRETVPLANRAVGAVASHDISLPLRAIPAFIDTASGELAARTDAQLNCFGHLGDGNLHFNLFPADGKSAAEYVEERADLTALVHELVNQHEGSISAEHGIGRAKTADLIRYKDSVALQMMQQVKDTLDPNGILNPGAVLTGGRTVT